MADLEDRCSALLAENLHLTAELRTIQAIARSLLIDAAGDPRQWIPVEEIRLKAERMMGSADVRITLDPQAPVDESPTMCLPVGQLGD